MRLLLLTLWRAATAIRTRPTKLLPIFLFTPHLPLPPSTLLTIPKCTGTHKKTPKTQKTRAVPQILTLPIFMINLRTLPLLTTPKPPTAMKPQKTRITTPKTLTATKRPTLPPPRKPPALRFLVTPQISKMDTLREDRGAVDSGASTNGGSGPRRRARRRASSPRARSAVRRTWKT